MKLIITFESLIPVTMFDMWKGKLTRVNVILIQEFMLRCPIPRPSATTLVVVQSSAHLISFHHPRSMRRGNITCVLALVIATTPKKTCGPRQDRKEHETEQ